MMLVVMRCHDSDSRNERVQEIVISPDQVLELMQQGEAHRHVGRTNMNEFSSRSHTIFRMIIESREVESAESAEKKTQARRASRAGGRIGLEGAVKVSLLVRR